MVSDLDIRPAELADAAQLVELWVEFGSYYDAIDPVQFQVPQRDGLLEKMKHDLERERSLDELWLVADRGGKLVGYVRAQILRPNDEDASRHILRTVGVTTVKTDSLMVTDSERRQRVGTALMERVEIWGTGAGGD